MKKFSALFKPTLFILFCILNIKGFTQRNTITSGGNGNGTGGNFSYTVGQVDYNYATSVSGNITQGLQQTYKLTLNLKAFIEGYYAGGGLMQAVMLNQGVIGANSNQCDSIMVEIRTGTIPYTLIESQKVVLNTDGLATIKLFNHGSFYIVIKHRNGLQTWSNAPVTLNGSLYDFTTHANKSFGDNQILIAPGDYAFYAGDLNQDESMDLLDLGMLEADIGNFESGYVASDINGDGNVDLLDSPVLETNINNFVFSIHP